MNKLTENKVALVFGFLISGLHLAWSILVLSGMGQMIVDFVLWAHMIHIQVVIGPFDIMATLVLLLMTFILGYITGFVFAKIWNYLHN